MTYTMTYTGTLDLSAPNLKVLFVDDEGTKVGSLLSATIPIPEPDTYALMIAGLGVIGFIARRRQQQQA
jgi:hypothetical protein